jgi:hypothetical protein
MILLRLDWKLFENTNGRPPWSMAGDQWVTVFWLKMPKIFFFDWVTLLGCLIEFVLNLLLNLTVFFRTTHFQLSSCEWVRTTIYPEGFKKAYWNLNFWCYFVILVLANLILIRTIVFHNNAKFQKIWINLFNKDPKNLWTEEGGEDYRNVLKKLIFLSIWDWKAIKSSYIFAIF